MRHYYHKTQPDYAEWFKELSRIPEHGEEMAGGSSNHKQVPDEMAVSQAVRGEEREAARISNSTRQYPENSRRRH